MATVAYSIALIISSIIFLIIRGLMFKKYGITAESTAIEDLEKLPTSFLRRSYRLSAVVFTIWFIFGWVWAIYDIVSVVTTNEKEISSSIYNHPKVFGITSVFIGVLLSKVRKRFTFYYGVLELAVAIGALWFAIVTPNQDLLPKILGILGGVYIIVRGLDNMGRDLPARCPKWLTWLVS